MLVRCNESYRGFSSGEKLLRAGEVYRVDDEVGRYLLATGQFEPVKGRVKGAIRLDSTMPSPDLAATVDMQLRDGAEQALIIVLESKLEGVNEALARLEAELAEASSRLELLRAGLETGELGKSEEAEAGALQDKAAELGAEKAKSEAARRGLRRRLKVAQEALDGLRVKALCREFDALASANSENYEAYWQAARAVAKAAAVLWGDSIAAAKLATALRTLSRTVKAPISQRHLEGAGMRTPDVNKQVSRAIKDKSGRSAGVLL